MTCVRRELDSLPNWKHSLHASMMVMCLDEFFNSISSPFTLRKVRCCGKFGWERWQKCDENTLDDQSFGEQNEREGGQTPGNSWEWDNELNMARRRHCCKLRTLHIICVLMFECDKALLFLMMTGHHCCHICCFEMQSTIKYLLPLLFVLPCTSRWPYSATHTYHDIFKENYATTHSIGVIKMVETATY